MGVMKKAGVILGALALIGCASIGASAGPAPGPLKQRLAGCRILPPSDAFHRKVNKLEVASYSKSIIDRVGGSDLHPDFGSNPHYGIPYAVVAHGQRKVPVKIKLYRSQSDRGRRPIPRTAGIEGGQSSHGDRHTLVVRRGKGRKPCQLIELYHARYLGGPKHRWSADQVSVFNLGKRLPQRPETWTSADAAGLPILPGLVRYGEVRSGRIDHALRITFGETRSAYRHPATHQASDICAANRPPMGDRVRLRPGYGIGGIHGGAHVIAKALKVYGGIVADNGSDFYITGAKDRRWNDENLNQLKDIPGSAFQFVRSGAKLHLASHC